VRLGQNFLADTNLLEAIVSDSSLDPSDVVLEIGGGEGVLTERLAEIASRVHVIELDQRLRPPLEALEVRYPNVGVIWQDAMDVDLDALSPAPSAIVANLPYSIATPVLLRTIAELPTVGRWTVMVQREIAERLRARPGSRTYGGPSVIVQLCCQVRMLRSVDPAVFTPRPRVESAVLALRRQREAPAEAVRQRIRDTFAHRRKAIPKSLELAAKRRESEALERGEEAPRPRPAEVRHLAKEALVEIGLPADARAELLVPEQHLRLAEAIEAG